MKSLRGVIILAVLIASLSNASLLFAGEKMVDAYRELPLPEQDVLLQKMTGTLQSVKSLKADFVQERHLSLFLDVLSAKGRLYFEMPDRLRWELSEPYASVLIFNGGNVAKFIQERGKLVKMKLGMEDILQEVLKQIISIMRGNFKKMRDVYDISLFQGKDYRLSMRPSSAGLSKIITSLDLSIDPDSSHVTKITIREPQGDYIEIKFSGEEENRTLDNRLFDLNSPLPPRETKTTGNK
jgi:outer membrane lipoprotein-sorting protein